MKEIVWLFTSLLSVAVHAQPEKKSLDLIHSSVYSSVSLPNGVTAESIKEAVQFKPHNAPFRYNAPQVAGTGVAKAQWIVVDTSDQAACRKIHESIKNISPATGKKSTLKEFCAHDEKEPLVSVLVFEDIDSVEFRRKIDTSFLTSTEPSLINDTRNIAFSMMGTMGFLWLLPGASTGWDKEKISNSEHGIFSLYTENIKAGPIMDKDDAMYNWIDHPLAGSAYYVMARHSGLSPMKSFGYSVFMSTFFWEYGFEAFAEIPSIQDLIITPVIGSLLGELFYQLEQKVIQNDGRVLGSKKLGTASLIFLNPIGALSNGINKVLGSEIVQKSETNFVMTKTKKHDHLRNDNAFVGIEIKFLFW